jgi:hypothetical protein
VIRQLWGLRGRGGKAAVLAWRIAGLALLCALVAVALWPDVAARNGLILGSTSAARRVPVAGQIRFVSDGRIIGTARTGRDGVFRIDIVAGLYRLEFRPRSRDYRDCRSAPVRFRVVPDMTERIRVSCASLLS